MCFLAPVLQLVYSPTLTIEFHSHAPRGFWGVMESNIAYNEVVSTETPPEPHFDEEATLLSARPVVPLREVRAGARARILLAFGLTIIASLLVGALGTTLIYQRGQKQTTAIVQTSNPVSKQSVQEDASLTGAVGALSGSPAGAPQMAENTDEVTAPKVRNADTSTIKKPDPAISHSDASISGEREFRRAQRVETRRYRRQAEREARREVRRQKSQSADDLLRIREIFEGSPRP